MSAYVFATHGRYNPFLVTALPEHMEYPVSVHTEKGVDLDYSALMTADRFIIDSASYEYVTRRASHYFDPMKRSLKVLFEEGLLEIVYMEELFAANESRISDMTRGILRDPQPWLTLARAQWRSLKAELVDFQNTYGSPGWEAVNTGHVGIDSWLARIGRGDDIEFKSKLLKKLECNSREKLGINDLRGMLEFVVAQIVMSDLAASFYRQPVLDWDDSFNMYLKLYEQRWSSEQQQLEIVKQSRCLFDQVLPKLRPGCVEEFVKYVRQPGAVRSLRDELISVIDEGVTIDEKHILELTSELIRMDLVSDRYGRIVQRFGGLVGLIPGAPWLLNASLFAASELFSDELERSNDQFRWYIALQGNNS